RELDHAIGEIPDLHRLAHVEDEQVAARRIGAGEHDEPRRLGDRHEESRDLRVGQRDRAAGRDLAREQRDDGSGGAEHIAEADHGELGVGAAGLQILYHYLSEALGPTHHVRGANGLVRRDQYEALDLQLASQLGQGAGAEDVVPDSFDLVLLDKRDVLVGGGVQDDFDAVLLHDRPDPGSVADGAQYRRDLNAGLGGKRPDLAI